MSSRPSGGGDFDVCEYPKVAEGRFITGDFQESTLDAEQKIQQSHQCRYSSLFSTMLVKAGW